MTYSENKNLTKRTKIVKNMYGWAEHFNFCLNANKTVIKKLLSNETLKINACTDCGKSLLLFQSCLFFFFYLFPRPVKQTFASGNCSRINSRNAAFFGVGHLQFKLPLPPTTHPPLLHIYFLQHIKLSA